MLISRIPLLLVAVMTPVLLAVGGAQAFAIPGSNGLLVIHREVPAGEHTQTDIYSVGPDGSGLTPLTVTVDDNEFDPVWNPAGSLIAFWRTPVTGGSGSIWVMDGHGRDQRQLTGDVDARGPVWSSDGTRIAFTITVGSSVDAWSVRASDGGDLQSVASSPSPPPAPDGTSIALAQALAAGNGFVAPFDATSFSAGVPTDADSARVRRVLANTNRYALTTWWNMKFAAQTGNYLNLGGTAERNVRPPASEGLALAAALATGAYSPSVTGVSRAKAVSVTVRLIGSVAKQHLVNTAGGWGNGWQTAYWASLAGTGGWLLWNSLTPTDRELVRKMVEYEANRFIGWPVPYWKDRAGNLVAACGDTKAEESAWNSQLLMLAPTMMPQHNRRSGWAYKAAELAVGAYARPADLRSSADVLGRPVMDWLDGTNVNDDGTLINHTRHHPDYVTTLVERTFGGIIASLAHRVSPPTVVHNAALPYSMLVDKPFWPAPALPCPASPAFVPPPANDADGTVYIDESSAIYYPEGNDWGTDRRMHFSNLDATARAYAFGGTQGQTAAYWESLHAQRVLDMQNRSGDRRTYVAAGEDTYPGREEWVAVGAAQAWLTKWAASKSAISVQNSLAQIVLDDHDRATSVTGGWTAGTPASNGTQVFGPTVRYKVAGNGSASVTFTPRLSRTRTYKVYGWWTSAPAQATNSPYTIRHASGTTTVRANQTVNGERWNLLGTFSLGPGSYLRLTDAANGYVVADGILLDPN